MQQNLRCKVLVFTTLLI